jgi:hypothetical protein
VFKIKLQKKKKKKSNLFPDTIYVIKITLTIKEITVYSAFDTVNKSSSFKK